MDKQVWNGEGLPPVGTVCEAPYSESGMTYLKTKVFGVNEHGQPIHRWEEGPRQFEYQASVLVSILGNPVFRPIRTPEQIEAERRERVTKQMFDAWNQSPSICYSGSFYSVYDAILAGKIEGVKIDEHP